MNEATHIVSWEESAPLLANQQLQSSYGRGTVSTHNVVTDLEDHKDARDYVNTYAVLPIALAAALAMAATSATTIFAYATLTCKDPTNCKESEQHAYAGAVATASTVANICGLLALGSVEKLSRKNHKAGLILWLITRSMSVVMLAFGEEVCLQNIGVALSGRIFEGLASDNLLHFNLNAIYVQTPERDQVSRLIGASLGLYMVGISISPMIAGLFESFVTSFIMALGIFAVTLLYLIVFVSQNKSWRMSKVSIDNDDFSGQDERTQTDAKMVQGVLSTFLSPLGPYYERPSTLFPGLSLLFYNTVQAYIFPAFMVHTSLRFGFTSKQNGFVISLAHGVSAIYLFLTLFAIPKLTQILKQKKRNNSHSHASPCPSSTRHHSSTPDAFLALLSFTTQILSLTLLSLSNLSWQIYPITALSALGLATPSFIKSYFVIGFLTPENAPRGLAALAMMETLGGLLAPILLGGWQAVWPGPGVFGIAALALAVAAAVFTVGFVVGRVKGSEQGD